MIVVAAWSCLCASISARADEAVVGQVENSHPTVGSKLDGRSRSLADGVDVHRNEQLWTGAGGRLQVALSDGGTVAVGENARLTLDDFVLPKDGAGRLLIRSITGAFRFIGGAIDKSAAGAVKIVTPAATMTVRGTDFFAGPIDGAYGVFVFHGRVEVATAGGSVSLTDGEGTSVTRSDAPPGAVKRWPADKIARAEKLVGF
ncbi:MAG TPA: FecR family protein [Dongiaceae bacterium]|nr:FecR family protein [Dongiaceae bacterium]